MIAFILCMALMLCIAGCGADDSDIPSTSAPTVDTTVPTVAVDYTALYTAARENISSSSDLIVTYTLDESRVVGGETYSEHRDGSASYLALNTDGMEAMVSEEVTYGGYSTQYIESYIAGSAYCRVNNYSFRSDITQDEFLAQQIPAAVLDETLYSSITGESANDTTVITFSGASAAESWLQLDEQATVHSAQGTATLDAGGNLIGADYQVSYTLGAAEYTLEITMTVEVSAADLTAVQPVYPENCTVLSDLQIPRYLLQIVGDVYTAQAMSVSYTDTLYSEAFSVIRSQSSSFDTYGSGDGFMAKLTSQVSVTDYVGNVDTNSQTIIYQDGLYTSTVNSNSPVSDSSVTAEQVRTACEDSILSSLFTLDAIAGAEITDTGDFLYIRFAGSDDFAETICSNIYALFQMDLDTFAQSYTTESAGGYVTINKYTLLPTAMGMELSRTHVIDGISYRLTYQLDQAMYLASMDAYENITGQTPDEAATTATSAPLFYKVTGTDGQTLWLLGTIHIGDGRTANLPQQILDAFAEANALAVECDTEAFEEAVLTDASLQTNVAKAYFYSGSTTDDHLSKELYAKLQPLALATGSNNINSSYLKVSVWQTLIENLYLQQGYSLSPSQGMDLQLLRWAKEQEKPIYEIETALSQLQMLTNFSDKLQALQLQQLLDGGMIGYCSDAQQLYELWCQGDEAALTQALTEDTSALTEDELKLYDEYYKAMYTDRNAKMLKAATTYLESGETVFYAVGLAHLLGEDGLVEALRAAGYTVEIVMYN